jgi:hypothetical protein
MFTFSYHSAIVVKNRCTIYTPLFTHNFNSVKTTSTNTSYKQKPSNQKNVKGKHSWTTNQTIITNKAKKKEDLRYYTKNYVF